MTKYVHHLRTPAALLLTVFLASCTPIPVYQPPADMTHGAHLRLSFTDQSLFAGVAIISRIEGDIVCGEALPNLKKMIVISKGNPLISNLNPSGVYIPAGERFVFSAKGLRDGARGCGRIVSFVPKAGADYEIALTNTMNTGPTLEPVVCPIAVMEIVLNRDTNENTVIPVETRFEQCKPQK